MIHIRIDDHELNSKAKFACGIPYPLPEGDQYVHEADLFALHKADCPTCNPGGPRQYGTPLSELSGQPGQPGYSNFKRIASSWGYD